MDDDDDDDDGDDDDSDGLYLMRPGSPAQVSLAPESRNTALLHNPV